MLHFAAHFSVQSRSFARDFSYNSRLLYSRVFRAVQLTSLSAVRDLTYLFKSGLRHKGAIKEPIKRNKMRKHVCTHSDSASQVPPTVVRGTHVSLQHHYCPNYKRCSHPEHCAYESCEVTSVL